MRGAASLVELTPQGVCFAVPGTHGTLAFHEGTKHSSLVAPGHE